MAYQAEIRTVSNATAAESAEPNSLIVRHHRSGRAELKVDELSGGHLLHMALAGCVFNNIHRIAQDRGIRVHDASVAVDGGFNEEGNASTGISCRVMVAGEAAKEQLAAVAREAFDNSSIAAILRQTTTVDLAEITLREL
ncbi:MAG TPA: OsmC family protein [Candidatus Dormibacteraeota bacterium]